MITQFGKDSINDKYFNCPFCQKSRLFSHKSLPSPDTALPSEFICFCAYNDAEGNILHDGTATIYHRNGLIKANIPDVRQIKFVMNELDDLEKNVGTGAFGVVFSTFNPIDCQSLALKKVIFSSTTQSIRRVLREIVFLDICDHENIVKLVSVIYNAHNDPFRIYFIFEHMQTDLHNIIISSQILLHSHIELFMYQILRGIKFLHSAKIVHRDLKPGNMLVNSNCLLKICDLGLARSYIHGPKTVEVITQCYRPPELVCRDTMYDITVDIWSIGCIFAELLNRKILFFKSCSPQSHIESMMDLLGAIDPRKVTFRLPKPIFQIMDNKRQRMLRKNYVRGLESSFPSLSFMGYMVLKQMLAFIPQERTLSGDLLNEPYFNEARLRFHNCMCMCCPPNSLNSIFPAVEGRQENRASISTVGSDASDHLFANGTTSMINTTITSTKNTSSDVKGTFSVANDPPDYRNISRIASFFSTDRIKMDPVCDVVTHGQFDHLLFKNSVTAREALADVSSYLSKRHEYIKGYNFHINQDAIMYEALMSSQNHVEKRQKASERKLQ